MLVPMKKFIGMCSYIYRKLMFHESASNTMVSIHALKEQFGPHIIHHIFPCKWIHHTSNSTVVVHIQWYCSPFFIWLQCEQLPPPQLHVCFLLKLHQSVHMEVFWGQKVIVKLANIKTFVFRILVHRSKQTKY